MAGGGDGHGESTSAILAAFLANLGIAIAKFVGFLITSSSAMLAESIHSVADSSNQGLLFLGGRRSQKPPSALHQFGYGRNRYFFAFVVAVVLFTLGGLFSFYEGMEKILHPHEIESPIVAYVIFGAAMVFEALALRTAVSHARAPKGDRSWVQYIKSSRSPELPVLLLEDSGALIGLSFALLGVILSQVTGEPVFDGIGTLMVGILLIGIGIVLAIEMKSLLLGEAADPETVAKIESEIERGPEVKRLIHIITQHLGPDELLVAAKVEFDSSLAMADLSRAINETEARVRAAVPIAKRLYIEPDIHDPALAPAPDEPGAVG